MLLRRYRKGHYRCSVDKKGGKNYFGYKNHIGIDAEHRLIRRYVVTNASIEILTRQNRIKGVY